MKKCVGIFSLLIMNISAGLIVASLQTFAEPRVTLQYPVDADIVVAPFDPRKDTRFALLFQRSDWQRLSPYVALLTNKSSSPVAALTLKWFHDGKPAGLFRTDSGG